MNKAIIESFEQGCQVLGIDTALPVHSWMPENRAKAMTATYKMDIIEAAQNKLDNFVADYSDPNQGKYYAWLWFDPSVGAFVFLNTHFTLTFTYLGSRFCFKDRSTAEAICKKHIELYRDMMLKA